MIKKTPRPSGDAAFFCARFLGLAFGYRAIFGHDWRPA
jgi:hypothetical protein